MPFEIDNLDNTKSGTQGFGLSDICPKRLITIEELNLKMCLLNPNQQDNSYFNEEDINTYTSLKDETTMISSSTIAEVQMQTMDDSILDRITMAGMEDDRRIARKEELSQLKETREALPKPGGLEN